MQDSTHTTCRQYSFSTRMHWKVLADLHASVSKVVSAESSASATDETNTLLPNLPTMDVKQEASEELMVKSSWCCLMMRILSASTDSMFV